MDQDVPPLTYLIDIKGGGGGGGEGEGKSLKVDKEEEVWRE